VPKNYGGYMAEAQTWLIPRGESGRSDREGITMTRKEFTELYGKEPLLAIGHGTVCVRGYSLSPANLRSLLAQKIADLASLALRLAYAAIPRQERGMHGTFITYQPK
jgi:hypothetical protein